MNENPLQTFFKFVASDKGIVELEEAIGKLEKEIALLKMQQQGACHRLEKAKHDFHEQRKVVDTYELEMKELDELEAAKKKRLDNVSDYKEYKTMQHEVELLGKKQLGLEELLLTAWKDLENVQRLVTKSEHEETELIKQLEQKIAESQQKIDALKQKLYLEKEQHDNLKKTVSIELLEQFLRMRAQVSDPVVPVVSESCSACFYPVTKQDLMALGRKKLLLCKGCFRFLYLEAPEEPTS